MSPLQEGFYWRLWAAAARSLKARGMTPQEVAIARSHVEVWKTIATGSDDHVLVLEDDVWFRRGAAAAIDRGWRAPSNKLTQDHGERFAVG